MRRETVLLKYIRGKDVLDIGSVGQDLDPISRALVVKDEAHSQKYYLWNFLKTHAQTLTGIDLEASPEGQIVRGNMETHSFGKQFEVIVAGDVLEHVSNQGLFLENIHRHLKPGGHLVVSTPNAKWWTVFLKPNETHSLWHDRFTLKEALRRARFEIVELHYYPGNKPHYPLWKRILAWRQALCVVAATTP